MCNLIKSKCTDSNFEVRMGSFEFGGEDLFNLSDDGDFDLSMLGVISILGSPSFTFFFLLFLSSRGRGKFLSGIILSLLLDGELLDNLDDLLLGILSSGRTIN